MATYKGPVELVQNGKGLSLRTPSGNLIRANGTAGKGFPKIWEITEDEVAGVPEEILLFAQRHEMEITNKASV